MSVSVCVGGGTWARQALAALRSDAVVTLLVVAASHLPRVFSWFLVLL